MLELLALVFLSRDVANIAERKGLKRGWWRFYTILAWFIGEIIGAFIALLIFRSEEVSIGIYLFAIAFAFVGYFLVKTIVSKRPDIVDGTFDFEAKSQQQ